MTYGVLASDESTYPQLLDRWSSDVRFQNYGFPTYGTAQEVLLYRRLARSVDHRLVILGYFSNDPADNARRDQSRFRLVDGQLVLGPPLQGRGVITIGFVDRVQRFFAEHTATYDFVAPKLKRLLHRVGAIKEPAAGGITGKEAQEQLELTGALLRELAAEAERSGARLLIVALTRPEDVAGKPGSADGVSWEQQLSMLEQVATSSPNVGLLDMTPILAAEMGKEDRVYGKMDAHLDDYGHYVVARAIFLRLTDEGYMNNSAAKAPAFDEAKTNVDRCP